MVAGVVAAYAYLWRRALPPLPISAALAAGALVAAALGAAGAFLTGALIGLPSELPWALPYFGVLRHPVALYYAVGLVLLLVSGWWLSKRLVTGRLLLLWILGVGLLLLLVGAYEEGSRTILSLRLNQCIGLCIALVACWSLAQRPVDKTT